MNSKKKIKIQETDKKHVFELEIPREEISSNAIKVVSRLKERGYQAYLIGGCVRDSLLGKSPKDFDVATNATPSEIRSSFSNCRIIGKRFLLAHILFRNEIIEVATFRTSVQETQKHSKTKILAQDNNFGTIEQDVLRRDFTLNALYYDPIENKIVDLVGGLNDLESKVVRVIGNPLQRFQEDPVRMIRAARYAAKLSLKLDIEAKEALLKKGSLILHVPKARLLEEFHKCFFNEQAYPILKLMNHFKIARFLVPREILKPALIKKIGKSCQMIAGEDFDRDKSMYLLFIAFYLAFSSLHPKEKAPKLLSLFFEKFQRLILIPKQFEQNFKKIVHNHSSSSKPRGTLRDYQKVIKFYREIEKKFAWS